MKNLLTTRFKIFRRIIPAIVRRLGIAKYFNIVYKIKFGKTSIKFPILGGDGESLIQAERDWKYDLLTILLKDKEKYIFIDVGANIGQTFLDLLLALGSDREKLRYYAFEPNIECFYILKKFVFCNLNNATLFPWACSNKNDFEKIFLLNKFDSGGAIIPSIRSRSKCNYEYISTYKLDANKDLELSSGFILKIDVEGYENEVIEGAIQIIKNYRPIILCEVLHAESNDLIQKNTKRKKELSELFKSLEYQIWQIRKSNNSNKGRLIGIELISDFPKGLCWWDSPSSIDFLITPSESLDEISKLNNLIQK